MILPVQKDLYAVVGNPVGHSLSPAMMNAVFRSLGIPAVYVALQSDSFAEDLVTLEKMGFRGLSVTIPHKEAAFRLASPQDKNTWAIGAVNTLKRGSKGWEGRNTDWLGAMWALKGKTALAGRRALVIGAGGAARALVYGLKREGARPTVANRSVERGKSLAHDFDCGFLPLADLERTASDHSFDVVVQCTPLGLAGGDPVSPVSKSLFRPGMVVMDTVYRPMRTPFAILAEEAGCTLVPGLEMLLHQGVAQLEWWLGRPVPADRGVNVMREALLEALESE
ncbi:MAG: shikimate dehydrogenase [Desulfobacteraceae bacterium]|nr:shikimate dehydrogenase [Desulfobacteraceae bacterium]